MTAALTFHVALDEDMCGTGNRTGRRRWRAAFYARMVRLAMADCGKYCRATGKKKAARIINPA
jgi:hypothetical protein